ncbi:MAG: UDP-2,3-diacylglucosamine diphosphatase LpxI [Synergistota bacterium]|jgi:hypothetical protein|nr:UDP-2,3-diacylglucosamine diphosphatase LpxI [Synergistota bacterium]OPZ41183.1 MAG: hypothetical protein BWY99_00037 [Synergistetes bacterium ADurb.BinA166]
MTQENSIASSTRAVRPALVAGGGELPVLIARQASRLGVPLLVYCTGDTAPFASIAGVEAMPLPAGGLDMSAALREMIRRGADSVILAGMVPKNLIYAELPDPLLKEVVEGGGMDDHSLLGRVVAAFESAGLEVLPYAALLGDSLAPEGHIAGRPPSAGEMEDVEVGRKVLSAILPLSFGQGVVVARGAVVAVEAMEGTDAMIRRAGDLVNERAEHGASPGGVLVKMMRPDQDPRFDVPVVGVDTIRNMKSAGLTCLAVESGRTLLLDADRFRELAGPLGISVVGVSAP